MKNCFRLFGGLVAASTLIISASTLSFAQITPEAARAISAKNDAAFVCVKVNRVMTYSAAGQDSEKQDDEVELSGVVIDPNGLTLVSLLGVDPGSLMDTMMGQRGTAMPKGMNFKVDLKGITIRYPDGTEVPGEVALRDKDRDLAYLRPKTKPAAALTAVNLADSVEPSAYEHVITISRAPKNLNWITVNQHDYISAVATKPRKHFLLSRFMSLSSSDIGATVFNKDGKVLGVQLLRFLAGSAKESGDMIAVIVPAKDILATAAQTKQ